MGGDWKQASGADLPSSPAPCRELTAQTGPAAQGDSIFFYSVGMWELPTVGDNLTHLQWL